MTRYHVVGAGGMGMSAVARLLLAGGEAVSGSDSGRWPLADALARDGARIYQSFAADHLGDADVVIRSSAYHEDNPEIAAALARGIPVWRREDAWRLLAEGRRVVAVAGTHGKSTTTALVWVALRAGGIDASLVCGAVLRDLGSNAYRGRDDVLVIEADEYDNAFLALRPLVAVVTTVDHDHVDVFPTPDAYRSAFRRFAANVREDGFLVCAADDPGARALAEWASASTRARVRTYGALAGALAIPGAHNARNAAGALAAAACLGVDGERPAAAVRAFSGVERRLELVGAAGDIRVVDDYAHHPAEIAAGLAAYGERAVVVFQPHTPSRLAAFFDEFAAVLRRARAVIVIETFSSAREGRDEVSRARALADAVGGRYVPDAESAARAAAELARPGDVVLVMGAGDVRPVGERLLELLRAPV